MAKRIIRLITAVGETVRKDPRTRGRIEVVFLPDYRVSLAETIVPAADLSEQISTAGKEASGTGNMKLSMNGALTIGTLDGANVEIRDEVGPENFFLFGLTAAEVERMRREGSYDPWAAYQADAAVRRTMDALARDTFCPSSPGHFLPVFRRILGEGDEYFHLADFPSYEEAHRRVGEAFLDRARWREMAIRNVARMGKFSSDRTIAEYARDIWDVAPAL
jgi:starch phosphorylase